jgi:O-antigen/teichoic acid export membrane protein
VTEPAATPALARRLLGSRAARGTVVTVLGQVLAQGLRVAGNLMLARLLFPEAFGLMALVNVLMIGLNAISDVGLQPAIVRHARGDDRRFLDTAWTLQAGRGFVLWAAGALIGVPMAAFYGEPQLAAIAPAACLAAAATGLASTKVATLTRSLAPSRVVMIEIGSQALALAVMVVLAYRLRSVWALVAGGLVAALLRMLASHFALPGPGNRLAWHRDVARELVHFGKWITISSIFTFVAMRVDVALLGKLLSLEALGIYSVGVILSGVVRDVLGQVTRFVVMPTVSAANREGGDAMARSVERVRRGLLPIALLGVLAASVVAPAFFTFLYDERYRDAAWIAQLSMLGVWFSYLTDVTGSGLLAAGDSRAWAVSNAFKAFATSAGCALGFAAGGLVGLMLGSAAASAATYLVAARLLTQHGARVVAGDLPYTLAALVLGLAAAGLPRLVVEGGDDRLLALATLASGAAAALPVGLWALRSLRGTVAPAA